MIFAPLLTFHIPHTIQLYQLLYSLQSPYSHPHTFIPMLSFPHSSLHGPMPILPTSQSRPHTPAPIFLSQCSHSHTHTSVLPFSIPTHSSLCYPPPYCCPYAPIFILVSPLFCLHTHSCAAVSALPVAYYHLDFTISINAAIQTVASRFFPRDGNIRMLPSQHYHDDATFYATIRRHFHPTLQLS